MLNDYFLASFTWFGTVSLFHYIIYLAGSTPNGHLLKCLTKTCAFIQPLIFKFQLSPDIDIKIDPYIQFKKGRRHQKRASCFRTEYWKIEKAKKDWINQYNSSSFLLFIFLSLIYLPCTYIHIYIHKYYRIS